LANIKSQIKRNKQNESIRMNNVQQKSRLKTTIKKAKSSIDSKESSDSEKKAILDYTYKIIDTASRKNIIKKNTASRYKSSLAKKLNK